jgi:hypothetical protein
MPDVMVVDVHEGCFFYVNAARGKHEILKRQVVYIEVFYGGGTFHPDYFITPAALSAKYVNGAEIAVMGK